MAFVNHMTIAELFMSTILKSYEDRYRNGLKRPLVEDYIGNFKENELINNILSVRNRFKNIFIYIVMINLNKNLNKDEKLFLQKRIDIYFENIKNDKNEV